MVPLTEVPTPALLLDVDRLDRNIARIAERCAALGVRHRAHLKTAKAIAIARRIPAARREGITVSTLTEAEYFADHGLRDILYAVAITPDKLPRATALIQRGVRLLLATDDDAVVPALEAAAERAGADIPVLIEIDSGEHRSGLRPQDPALLELGAALHRAPHLDLQGVFTHAGHSYDARGRDALRAVAELERAAAVTAGDRLRDAGLPCPIVSVGSTPTLVHAGHLEGVTEVRAGVYVFFDAFQAGLGTCALDDVAVTVLTSVIGRHRDPARVLVDAGSLALSKDRSTAALGQGLDCGYGWVGDEHGGILPGLAVAAAYQEHGVITGPELDPGRFPPGRRLRILPNHACLTSAAYEQYEVVQNGAVVATWPRTNRWC